MSHKPRSRAYKLADASGRLNDYTRARPGPVSCGTCAKGYRVNRDDRRNTDYEGCGHAKCRRHRQ